MTDPVAEVPMVPAVGVERGADLRLSRAPDGVDAMSDGAACGQRIIG